MGKGMQTFLGLVVLIVVIAILANLGGNDDKSASNGTTTNSSKDAPLTYEGVASNVAIRVDNVDTTDKVGDNQFTEAKAQGVFKVISLSIKNGQKDAITVDTNSYKLVDDQGREFSASSNGQMAFMGNDNVKALFLEKVNPGIQIQGVIVFDVPADAKGLYLEARGGFTGKKIKLKVD